MARARGRHGHCRRPEDLDDLLQHPNDFFAVVVDRPDALEARVAVAVFRGHVDRGVAIAVDPVHGVAAGVECEVADQSPGVNLGNPRELRHLFAGGIAVLVVAGTAEEVAGEVAVELGHADFEGVQIVVVAVSETTRRVLGGRGEHVPGVRGGLGGHDGGLAVAESSRERLFQVNDLVLEVGVGKRLSSGEDKVPAGVATGGEGEAEIERRVAEEGRDGFEELGGPTGLDDDLGRVDEEAGLG